MGGIKGITHGTLADEKTLTKAGNIMKIKNASASVTGGEILYLDSNGDLQQLNAGTDGQFLQTNGDTAAPSWENVSKGFFAGSATASMNSTTAPFAAINGSNSNATESVVQIPVAVACSVRNFRVRAATNTYSVNFNVRVKVNGSNSTIIATINAGSTATFSDTTNTVALSAGDLICIIIENAGGIGTGGASNFNWSLEIV